MKLMPQGDKGRYWLWKTEGDFSEEQAKPETFLVKFKDSETASTFKETFERVAQSQIVSTGSGQVVVESHVVSEPKSKTKLLFEGLGKLYSTDCHESGIKLKGSGTLRVVKNISTGISVLQMKDGSGSILCSHEVDSLIQLTTDPQDGKRVSWSTTSDVSSGARKAEQFTVEFLDTDVTTSFCQAMSKSHDPLCSSIEDVLCEQDVIFVKEELPSDDLIEKAESLMLPRAFYNYLTKPPCKGCIGCEDSVMVIEARSEKEDQKKENDVEEFLPKSHSAGTTVDNVLFGTASTGLLSFADLTSGDSSNMSDFKTDGQFSFTGAGQQLFQSPRAVADECSDPEEEVCVSFKPIVTLPESYKYKIDDEQKNELFDMKGKLFRFDAKTKSWKERGVGKMKLQEYPQSGKYRLLMREIKH